MTWIFSHCEQDHFPDGCSGCPALPDKNGKPRADHCAAVFVEVKPKAPPAWSFDVDWGCWLFGVASFSPNAIGFHLGPLIIVRVRA